MSEKKNIDRLFREKFKDFEVAPPDYVWENIRETLQEKNKRRVVPLWIRLSGVAAILVAGFLFVTSYLEEAGIDSNPVVIENTAVEGQNPQQQAPVATPANEPGVINQNPANTAVAVDEDTPGTRTSNGTGTNHNTTVTGSGINRAGYNQTDAVAQRGNTAEGTTNNAERPNNTAVREAVNVTVPSAGQAVAEANSQPANNNDKAGSNSSEGISPSGIITNVPANEAVADNAAGTGSNNNSNNATQIAGEGNNTIDRNIPVVNEEAVAATTTVDTATIAQENELEKLRQEQLNGSKEEEEALAENTEGRWNIKPQVAPLFYNSLSSGSPIDEQFAANSKSYDNEMSFGVGVNYALTDRLTIRSGVNTVNLSYATNDIQFHASLNQSTINVASSADTNIVVHNGDQPAGTDISLIGNMPTQTYNGSMVQETGYIEVPLEMSYALLNKKFGIEVIGGVSTLFLNENRVSAVSSNGYSANIGSAQNLNDVHFSTNVGLGFTYRFLKSFQASFEPMFKYQVNAYSRDAGNFRPYFIGLYSGVSFSF